MSRTTGLVCGSTLSMVCRVISFRLFQVQHNPSQFWFGGLTPFYFMTYGNIDLSQMGNMEKTQTKEEVMSKKGHSWLIALDTDSTYNLLTL